MIEPFSLPLNKSEFQQTLRQGLGRARLHLQKHGNDWVEAILMEACLSNLAYDPQCEGNRAPWLVELIYQSARPEMLIASLLPQLPADVENYWDATQRCRIALNLAQRGVQGAREVLYACLRYSLLTKDIIGASEIVEFDSADGLVHVATFLGSRKLADPNFYCCENPLFIYNDRFGQFSGNVLLQSLARDSPAIQCYLQNIDDHQNRRAEYQAGQEVTPSISFELAYQDLQSFDSLGFLAQFVTWAKTANETEWSRMLELVHFNAPLNQIRALLSIFERRQFENCPQALFKFVKHPEYNARQWAFSTLGNFKHPEIRAIAEELLSAGKVTGDEILLFKHNYQAGDIDQIYNALQVPEDQHQLHSLIMNIARISESIGTPELFPLLLFGYERTPCSSCRGRLVKELVELDVIPGWIAAECEHDAVSETRALVC